MCLFSSLETSILTTTKIDQNYGRKCSSVKDSKASIKFALQRHAERTLKWFYTFNVVLIIKTSSSMYLTDIATYPSLPLLLNCTNAIHISKNLMEKTHMVLLYVCHFFPLSYWLLLLLWFTCIFQVTDFSILTVFPKMLVKKRRNWKTRSLFQGHF